MESTADDKRIRYPKSAVPRPAAYPAIALPPPSVPVAVRRRSGYHRRRLGRASLTSIQANLALGEDVASIIDLAAVVVDCQDAPPMAAFYQAACGGKVLRSNEDAVWLRLGGMLVIFREVAGYQPPTWPSSQVPMQGHLDFFVDNVDEAEALLHQGGATTCDYQPHRGDGLVVMRDPAGHPFCLCTRVEIDV